MASPLESMCTLFAVHVDFSLPVCSEIVCACRRPLTIFVLLGSYINGLARIEVESCLYVCTRVDRSAIAHLSHSLLITCPSRRPNQHVSVLKQIIGSRSGIKDILQNYYGLITNGLKQCIKRRALMKQRVFLSAVSEPVSKAIDDHKHYEVPAAINHTAIVDDLGDRPQLTSQGT